MTPAERAIERLTTMFGEPKTNNPEGFLNEYSKALTGHDADVLDRAIDRVIATATFWPKPAEVLAEVHRIAAEKYRHTRRAAPEHEEFKLSDLPTRTPEEMAAVAELLANFKRFIGDNTTGERKSVIDWKRGQRESFEAMQRDSRNKAFHMTDYGLTQLSKRMTGETE